MHRAIMVYGPTDPITLQMTMEAFNEDSDRSVHVIKCHTYPQNMSAELMLTDIMDTIQIIDGSVGRDFSDAIMVMPKEDAETPWASGFGYAGWVLAYKKGEDYTLYTVNRDGLFDWWVPGGRWIGFMKAKDPMTEDAHGGVLDTSMVSMADLQAAVTGKDTKLPTQMGVWRALQIDQVDWEKMEADIPAEEAAAVEVRKELAEKGITIPTFREFFFTEYPALYDTAGPDNIPGYMAARRWETYHKYCNMLAKLRADHDLNSRVSFSLEPWRWSDKLLQRIAGNRARTLSCWIVNGTVYDLDDYTKDEDHFHKGLDALEALHPSTVVSVVDVHF